VDSLRKLGRLDEAMDAAVNGFVADDQRTTWTYGAWTRIMRCLVTDDVLQCLKIK